MAAHGTAAVDTRSPLIERLRSGGIVAPRLAVREARRAGLRLELACALLEKESAGGHNVYGHDPSIFSGRGEVTRRNYAEYKRQRLASRNRSMQGVGPCQLTWWEFQDAADAAGGCWRPEINVRTGFSHLAALVERYGESDGARRYNGSGAGAEAYSRDLLVRARRWEAVIDGQGGEPAGPARRAALRRGDAGKRVRRLTRRLARVTSPATGRPYLPEPASRVDEDVERAVKDFQRDHRLAVDGVAGPRTLTALARAHERAPERDPRARPQRDGRASAARPAAPRVSGLAQEVRRRDDEADRAWRRLVAYGHRRRRALLAERAAVEAGKGDTDAEDIRALLAALDRIEGRLGQLVDVTVHTPEIASAAPAPAAAETADTLAGGEAAPAAVTVAGGFGEGPAAAAPATDRPPERSSVAELLREVEALETRRRRLRDELIERYEHADERLARLGGGPRRAEQPGRDGHDRRDGERPRRPARRGGGASRGSRDPLGGRSAVTTLGDSGVFVRRSKIALSRYLAKHGNPEHAALRRRLRREAATPRTGNGASPAWGRAVEAAQRLTGRPVTGELDGELAQILLPYWPRDQLAKRMLRSTPAWRAIPGQLTPNFNVKELACKDPAHTPYVTGLMREQGLSRKQARDRARGLATRLERVRKLGGDRPVVVNSAFRTRAYNASLSGSATNSAHTRGFAVDTPPPRGISLEQHRQHVLQAFECGVGLYPMGRGYFVHGDFDRTLGGRRTW